jgi:hypothetical protein
LQTSGDEFIEQLVEAGLSAKVLRPGAKPALRAPAAHAQFAGVRVRHKPVIGLLFLSPADIARNGLPDHHTPPAQKRYVSFHRETGAGSPVH